MIPLLLSLLVAPAHAKSDGPYMWGVGPTINTIAYPGRFPSAIPKNDDGDRIFDTTEKVKGDVAIGARGVAYLNKDWRGGLRINLGTGMGEDGNGYRSKNLTLEVDNIPVAESGMAAFVGGGIGFGTMHFEPSETKGELDLSTYLFRGQAGGYYKTKTTAYEVNIFAVFVWPGVQSWSNNGKETEVSGGNYLHGGLEATVYFGDFKPPSNKKKKGGSGSSSSKKKK